MRNEYTNERFEQLAEQEYILNSELISRLIQEIRIFYKEFNDKCNRCSSIFCLMQLLN